MGWRCLEPDGSDIVGSDSNDRFGSSVSISSNGFRIAVGAIQDHVGSPDPAGYARVYEWNGTSWNQLGSDLVGENNTDRYGTSIDLSANGSIVAIGGIQNDDGPGSNGGHVRVFSWDGSSWNQLGIDIDGEAGNDNSGISVSLSADGTVRGFGADANDGAATNAGHVRVYKWDGSSWNQLGLDLDGTSERDEFGISVSLSGNGKYLAVGAVQNHTGSPDPPGYVQVYYWNETAWVQAGATLVGEADQDRFGTSVALTADGKRLVVGAPDNDLGGSNRGVVKVYDSPCNGQLYYRPSYYTQSGTNVSVQGGSDGSIRTLVLGGSGNYTYTWTGPSTGSGANPTGLKAGNYYLHVVDDNGCEGTAGPWTLREPN